MWISIFVRVKLQPFRREIEMKTTEKFDPWRHFDALIASSVVANGLIIRGTNAWDDRERARKAAGNTVMSYGSITDSDRTRGASAMSDDRWGT
jgi:hypothetical protein